MAHRTQLTAHLCEQSGIPRPRRRSQFLRSLISGFETQSQRDVAQIRAGIKGSAATTGAERLSAIAAELERLARDGQLENVALQLADLQKHADECLGYLPRVRSLAAEQLARPSK